MQEYVLQLKNIHKSYGEEKVLKGIDLDVARGELVTILGASGCGKTTLIRIIAGLIAQDTGSVVIDGKDVSGMPPDRREVNTIFQSYALFPHMNVYKNVAYGLKIKGVGKAETERRVLEALRAVQMSEYAKRSVESLSGGQKQRVAIARAIVNEPKILLLDEPLGALDARLKRELQEELKALKERLDMTFLYITHDQEEAINLSDRIVVMRNGKIEQTGTPRQIYYEPATSYVADFIGDTNILDGIVTQAGDDRVLADCLGMKVTLSKRENEFLMGQHVKIAVRYEFVRLTRTDNGLDAIPVVVKTVNVGRGMCKYTLETDSGSTICTLVNGMDKEYMQGEKLYAYIEPMKAALLALD